jgi:hypothetical protein
VSGAAGAGLRSAQERLAVARQVTRDLDGKAGGLLTATGVLSAVAAVLAGPAAGVTGLVGAWTRAGMAVAGMGLVTALVACLGVVIPRGRPDRWLAGQLDPDDELARVTVIATSKHVLLRVAVLALVVAVATGTVVGALDLLGPQ